MNDLGIAPLPKGRHNLTREQVARSQRLRLALAMADALAENGYADTPVATVLERAGVSRQTFYQLYDNKLDCFLDALDLVGEVLLDQLRGVVDAADGTTLDRATAAVDAYLAAITDNVAFARLYIVEVHAAGPRAMIRRAELQSRVVDALAALFGADDPDDRFACEAYVAAVSALVTLPIITGDLAALRDLRDPLVNQLARLDPRPKNWSRLSNSHW